MRPIKFRFYDLDKSKMITYPIEGITQNPLGQSLSTNIHPLISINGDICRPNWGSNCICMQFTGLTDKNGREIYEGDVVKSIRYSESYDGDIIIEREWELKGSVYFSTGTWRVINTAIPLYEWNKKTIEVIGNIYENPELIK